MSENPTLVLVPGGWHSPEIWDMTISLLAKQAYRCVPIALPSTAGDKSATFADDFQAVRDALTTETTQGRDVIVIGHSYGGVVGQSAMKGFTRPEEQDFGSSTNSSGHVIGLIMMATGFCQAGLSFLDGFGGKPPPSWKIDPSGFAVIVVPARELFYHDLAEEEGARWVSNLRQQSIKALSEGGELTYTGWMDVPVWFLATTQDKALPIQAQHMLVQLAKDAGADVTVREIESSHSPMLSRPQETADFIIDAVKSFTS